MSEYYTGNGIYEYLAGCREKENFYWTSGNMWLLVYGDKKHNPKVVTVASQRSFQYGRKLSKNEQQAMQTAQRIADAAEIPVNFIRFEPEKRIQEVEYWEDGMADIFRISSENLKERFESCGLTMNLCRVQKAINDRSSSPYHEWQRTHMGSSVVAADMDLIRLQRGKPTEILELKRSYIHLTNWTPYKEDYENFYLLSSLAKRSGLKFYIVYNRRIKDPYKDDISRLKLFAFDHSRTIPCRFLSYKTIEEFTAGKTDR